MKVELTMQERYNGWSAQVDGCEGESPLAETIMDALPDITYVCYDDGDCVGDPSDYEDEVRAKVAEIVKQPADVTIEYDTFSS